MKYAEIPKKTPKCVSSNLGYSYEVHYNMRSRYSHTKEQAFILRSKDLKKLINTLQERGLNFKRIAVSCKDDVSRDFESLDEFLNYENAKDKAISSMQISFCSVDYSQTVLIHFINQQAWSSISVSIDVSNNSNYVVREEIEDILSGMCPWYNFLTITKYSLLSGAIGAFIYFTFILWFSKHIQTLLTIEKNEILILTRLPTFVLLVIFMYLSIKVYGYVFPRGVFAINQGASRFEFQQKVLKWIMGVFASILVAGFIKLVFS